MNIITSKINVRPKIIFIGGVNIDNQHKALWEKCKKEILNDFTILDNKDFWEKHLSKSNIENIYVSQNVIFQFTNVL